MHMNRMFVVLSVSVLREASSRTGAPGCWPLLSRRTGSGGIDTGRQISLLPARPIREPRYPSLLLELFAELAVVLDGRALTEVLQLEYLADLEVAVLVHGIGAALRPLDCLGERLALPEPVAGHQL